MVTAAWEKQGDDPDWANDPDMVTYLETMKQSVASEDLSEDALVPGYINAAMIAQVLAACGDALTRENLLNKATHLSEASPPMLLPGIRLSNSPTDYNAFHQFRLNQFNGTRWVAMGGLIDLSTMKA